MARHHCPNCECDLDEYGLIMEFTQDGQHCDAVRSPSSNTVKVTRHVAGQSDNFPEVGIWEEVESSVFHADDSYGWRRRFAEFKEIIQSCQA